MNKETKREILDEKIKDEIRSGDFDENDFLKMCMEDERYCPECNDYIGNCDCDNCSFCHTD